MRNEGCLINQIIVGYISKPLLGDARSVEIFHMHNHIQRSSSTPLDCQELNIKTDFAVSNFQREIYLKSIILIKSLNSVN